MKENSQARNAARRMAVAALLLPIWIVAHAQSSAAAPTVHPVPAQKVARASAGVAFDVTRTSDALLAVGAHGNILRSADGKQWTQVDSPIDTALTGLYVVDGQHGWAVGHDAVIVHTADAGKTWTLQNFQPDLNAPLFAVTALDAQCAIAVGAFGTVKITADAGTHWSDVTAPAITEKKAHLNAITRLRDGRLLVVGESGLMGISANGQDWKSLPRVYEGTLFGVQPWKQRGAIVYGLLGNVYLSDDVGNQPWRKLEMKSTASLFGGVPLADASVVLVGANGTVVRVDEQAVTLLDDHASELGPSGTWTGAARVGDRLVLAGESGLRVIQP